MASGSKYTEEWETFNPIIRDGVPNGFLNTECSTSAFTFSDRQQVVNPTIVRETSEEPRPSSTAPSVFFRATEGTPRPKRKREEYLSDPEHHEEKAGNALSSLASAGRWMLSQLSRIPAAVGQLGQLISPRSRNKDDSQRSIEEEEIRPQEKRRRQSVTSEGLMRSLFGNSSTGRSPDTLNNPTKPCCGSSTVYTPECQRLQLECGMVEEDDGSMRPMTDAERRVIRDLPTYNSEEEQLADLKHVIEFRRASEL